MPKRNGYPTRRQDASAQERHKPDRAGEFDEGSHKAIDRGEEDWGNRASQAYDDGREMVDGVVSQYPYASVLTSFGFGFGFGLGVALLLTRRAPNWYERYVPDSLQHLPDRFPHIADRLKHLPESIAESVPRSWKPW
jgi:hypothetical protein